MNSIITFTSPVRLGNRTYRGVHKFLDSTKIGSFGFTRSADVFNRSVDSELRRPCFLLKSLDFFGNIVYNSLHNLLV